MSLGCQGFYKFQRLTNLTSIKQVSEDARLKNLKFKSTLFGNLYTNTVEMILKKLHMFNLMKIIISKKIKGNHIIDQTRRKTKPLAHKQLIIFIVLSIQSLPVSKPNIKCVDLFLWSAATIATTVNPSKRMRGHLCYCTVGGRRVKVPCK